MAGDVTFKLPASTPVEMGAKITSTVQLAPEARLAGHAFCVTVNPADAEITSWLAEKLLLLVTVTVCAALDEPATVGAKISWGGLAFRPNGTSPLPLRATVTGAFTLPAATVRLAELSPVEPGLKIT